MIFWQRMILITSQGFTDGILLPIKIKHFCLNPGFEYYMSETSGYFIEESSLEDVPKAIFRADRNNLMYQPYTLIDI